MNRKNIELEIDGVAFGGAGIGRLDGKAVFIPGALPGELVAAAIVEDKKRFAKAELLEVKQASPHRIKPRCPFALTAKIESDPTTPVCPGCAYQHAEYDFEMELKNEQFHWFLHHDAGMPEDGFLEPSASPEEYGYRNKIVLQAQGEPENWRLGYHLDDNRTVFDLPKCPLAHPEINRSLRDLRGKGHFWHSLRNHDRVTFRHTERKGTSWWRGKARLNDTWLVEESSLGDFSVPRSGFFQVNPGVREILLEEVSGHLKNLQPKCVLDLFCGVGVFSVAAAQNGAERIVGADYDTRSIQAAVHNATQRSLANCEFQVVDLNSKWRDPFTKNEKNDAVMIIDPPRSGLSAKCSKIIAAADYPALIYVSCAPDTLARDLRALTTAGYRPRTSRMLDMFPRTTHFESVTLALRE